MAKVKTHCSGDSARLKKCHKSKDKSEHANSFFGGNFDYEIPNITVVCFEVVEGDVSCAPDPVRKGG